MLRNSRFFLNVFSRFVFLVIFFIFSGKEIFAIEYKGIGGRPAFPRDDNPRTESIFIHTLEPGNEKEEGVLVINNTTETKTLLVYATDSVSSTDGAFACAQFADEKKDVGSWINLEKSEVTLAPESSELVYFKITIPQNASVGEHNGCVVIQEKKLEKREGGANISLRTGLRVAITIPGEIFRKLEIVDFSISKDQNKNWLLSPKVRNIGNVSIDANVRVETRYFFGWKYFTHQGQFPVLRGEISNWNFELKRPFWGGLFRSKFFVSYDENPQATVGQNISQNLTQLESKYVWFFSFPTLLAFIIEIVVLLSILLLLFFIWLWWVRRKWIKNYWVDYYVKPGDDINSLARYFDVSWKMIVKANKLKPPYELKPGQKIKVPPTR